MADKIALVSDAVAKLVVDTDLPSNKCITVAELNELTSELLAPAHSIAFISSRCLNKVLINNFMPITYSFMGMNYAKVTSSQTLKMNDASIFYYTVYTSGNFSIAASRNQGVSLYLNGGIYFISQ